ncbi:hypothetical protein HK104_007096 [Borealophlyctis nickersoniae]|nr:hypothetical protein HK104_007096 [Borealophlyctis nickersoniae]
MTDVSDRGKNTLERERGYGSSDAEDVSRKKSPSFGRQINGEGAWGSRDDGSPVKRRLDFGPNGLERAVNSFGGNGGNLSDDRDGLGLGKRKIPPNDAGGKEGPRRASQETSGDTPKKSGENAGTSAIDTLLKSGNASPIVADRKGGASSASQPQQENQPATSKKKGGRLSDEDALTFSEELSSLGSDMDGSESSSSVGETKSFERNKPKWSKVPKRTSEESETSEYSDMSDTSASTTGSGEYSEQSVRKGRKTAIRRGSAGKKRQLKKTTRTSEKCSSPLPEESSDDDWYQRKTGTSDLKRRTSGGGHGKGSKLENDKGADKLRSPPSKGKRTDDRRQTRAKEDADVLEIFQAGGGVDDDDDDWEYEAGKRRGRPPASKHRQLLEFKRQQIEMFKRLQSGKSGTADDERDETVSPRGRKKGEKKNEKEEKPKKCSKDEDEDDSEDEEEHQRRVNAAKAGKRAAQRRDEPGIMLSGRKRCLPLSQINSQDRSGRTPIFKYASSGDLATCEALISAGADLNIKDYAGWTPLHEACLEGHQKVVELLIEYGADVNAAGGNQDTPLHDAATNGHAQVVEILLGHGASVRACNHKNETPLDVAEDAEIRNLLRKWGDLSARVLKADRSGQTMLHRACAAGRLDQVRECLRYGADINAKDFAGTAPLHEAALKGHGPCVEELLRYGADMNAAGFEGDTPLHDAATNGHADVVALLLQFGADAGKRNESGKLPIDVADEAGVKKHLRADPESWKPHRTPERYGKVVFNADDADRPIMQSERVQSKKELPQRRRSSIGSESTVSSTAQASSVSHRNNLNAAFARGGLNFGESSREAKKLPALLKTIAALEGQKGDDGEKSMGRKRKRAVDELDEDERESVDNVKRKVVAKGRNTESPTPSSGRRRGRPPKRRDNENAAADATKVSSKSEEKGRKQGRQSAADRRASPRPDIEMEDISRSEDEFAAFGLGNKKSERPPASKSAKRPRSPRTPDSEDSTPSPDKSRKGKVKEKDPKGDVRKGSALSTADRPPLPSKSGKGKGKDNKMDVDDERDAPQPQANRRMSIRGKADDVRRDRAGQSSDSDSDESTRRMYHASLTKRSSRSPTKDRGPRPSPHISCQSPTRMEIEQTSPVKVEDRSKSPTKKKKRVKSPSPDNAVHMEEEAKAVVKKESADEGGPKVKMECSSVPGSRRGSMYDDSRRSSMRDEDVRSNASTENVGAAQARRKSKKRDFGISGYQRASPTPTKSNETPTTTLPPGDGAPPASSPAKMLDPEQQAALNDYRCRRCLPLYAVLLPSNPVSPSVAAAQTRAIATQGSHAAVIAGLPPRPRYMVDLQVGLFLGLGSGRALLDQYPHLSRRVATSAEKAQLETSPIAETVLASMLYGKDEDGRKWINWCATRSGGRGLKLSELDIHLLREDEVMREIGIRAGLEAGGTPFEMKQEGGVVVGDVWTVELDLEGYGSDVGVEQTHPHVKKETDSDFSAAPNRFSPAKEESERSATPEVRYKGGVKRDTVSPPGSSLTESAGRRSSSESGDSHNAAIAAAYAHKFKRPMPPKLAK